MTDFRWTSGRSNLMVILDGNGDESFFEVGVGFSGLDQITAAVADVIAGHVTNSIREIHQPISWTPPVGLPSTVAQDNQKWLIRYTDTVLNASGSYLLPTPDLSLLVPGSEFLDISTPSAVGTILREKLEQFGLSKDLNPITVDAVQFVII